MNVINTYHLSPNELPFSGRKINKALPTFEWVKNNVHTYTMGTRIPEESAIFRALDGVEFESSAVKEDSRPQMLPIAESIRVCLIG